MRFGLLLMSNACPVFSRSLIAAAWLHKWVNCHVVIMLSLAYVIWGVYSLIFLSCLIKFVFFLLLYSLDNSCSKKTAKGGLFTIFFFFHMCNIYVLCYFIFFLWGNAHLYQRLFDETVVNWGICTSESHAKRAFGNTNTTIIPIFHQKIITTRNWIPNVEMYVL